MMLTFYLSKLYLFSDCLYIEYCKYLYSMRNTGSSGRSKSSKDKGSKVASQNHTSNTVKSEGPPIKQIQVNVNTVNAI